MIRCEPIEKYIVIRDEGIRVGLFRERINGEWVFETVQDYGPLTLRSGALRAIVDRLDVLNAGRQIDAAAVEAKP